VGFLPVEDVRWLRDSQPWLAEMMADATGLGEYGPAAVDGQPAPAATPFADGLQIATEKAPGTTVLIPFDGLTEWQLWNTHKETSRAYLSFRSFLECEVTEREPVASVAEVRTLIARATGGDQLATTRLSRVVNPDAVPLLVAVVDSPRLGIQPALGLGRIGTPEALAALMQIDPEVARQAFVLAGTEEARNVLAARGDFESLFDLADPRGFELAAQAIATWDSTTRPWSTRDAWPMHVAVSILGLSHEQRYAEVLRPLLAHADQDVQFAAACALANLGVTEGEHRLALLADTPGFRHRSAAAAHVARYRRAREEAPS
jgi:hypothetical protein